MPNRANDRYFSDIDHSIIDVTAHPNDTPKLIFTRPRVRQYPRNIHSSLYLILGTLFVSEMWTRLKSGDAVRHYRLLSHEAGGLICWCMGWGQWLGPGLESTYRLQWTDTITWSGISGQPNCAQPRNVHIRWGLIEWLLVLTNETRHWLWFMTQIVLRKINAVGW